MPAPPPRPCACKEPIRNQVLASGVCASCSARPDPHARARGARRVLGARRLASWAGEQEARLEALVAAETRSAGYAVRAHALAAWANEVLA